MSWRGSPRAARRRSSPARPGPATLEVLLELLKPYPAGHMRADPVSTRVNSVRSDEPALLGASGKHGFLNHRRPRMARMCALVRNFPVVKNPAHCGRSSHFEHSSICVFFQSEIDWTL